MQHKRTYEIDGVFVLIAVCVLGCFLYATYQRNKVWQSSISLWTDASTKSPLKPRPRVNLARSFQEAGMFEDALAEYQTAFNLTNLPSTRLHERKITRQIAAMNMAQIMLKFGDLDMAERVLVQVWNEEPGFPGVAINLSIIYIQREQYEFALEILNIGLSELPAYPWFRDAARLHQNIGVVYERMGDCTQANVHYAMTARDPEIERAHCTEPSTDSNSN